MKKIIVAIMMVVTIIMGGPREALAQLNVVAAKDWNDVSEFRDMYTDIINHDDGYTLIKLNASLFGTCEDGANVYYIEIEVYDRNMNEWCQGKYLMNMETIRQNNAYFAELLYM